MIVGRVLLGGFAALLVGCAGTVARPREAATALHENHAFWGPSPAP